MFDKPMEKAIRKALKAVAKREGISVESVRREIDIAIAAARQNDDPAIHSFWDAIPTKTDESLTADDVIEHFARMHMDKVD